MCTTRAPRPASGSDAWFEHPLVAPEIVSFEHPDGGPLWAPVYRPEHPDPKRPALVHVHGGGYRQFAHRGWTVYGYALHLGFLVAAARWLVERRGIDARRIGIYGVSYGFMTLMSQFRYPGVFTAGVARAAVSDWAHYSDGWTSRILGVPHLDPRAYRISSPIYYAEGLSDHLLITHGLVDDNVHFRDTARLLQRLIELEKGLRGDGLSPRAAHHRDGAEPIRPGAAVGGVLRPMLKGG
jgi:dipeptidyl aminopeptidase/acylaminoacyl peptidase